ncbi:MAG: hypothetical protein A3F11_03260 [Gammaproteobacteria bacterium RIFCSPHIGHO2_12_FULL_37_14]|nr:MAG: hypothetical protein A3F11_03260 [Gammaproteobacteria bacterium RIFCSPHIGHO2_12_FULL_37_14]
MNQKRTIIIGGTKGLGRVVVRNLSDEGHRLFVLARNGPKECDKDIKDTLYFKANLMDESSFLQELSNIIDMLGKIHNLIFLQRFRGEEDCWSGDLEVGLNATRKIINHLKDKFDTDPNVTSSIVMVSSVAGNFANNTQPLSYSIAKAGINHMVKYYAAELGSYGIRVNGVSPIGFMKEESRKYYMEDNKKMNELYQQIIPLRRMCTSEDVANVISFLCSDKASFISGQNIVVDGGLSVVAHETLAMNLT